MKEQSTSAYRLTNPGPNARQEFPMASVRHSFPVIAMAASVGGLKALSIILGALPADFPATIAIVMHVAPDHKSLLSEILKCRTHMQVTEAHTGDVLVPSMVFVAPPNHHLFVVRRSPKVVFLARGKDPFRPSVGRAFVCFSGGDLWQKCDRGRPHRRRWRRLLRCANHQGQGRHGHRPRPAHIGKFQHAGNFHQNRRCGLCSTTGSDRTHVDRLGVDQQSTKES